MKSKDTETQLTEITNMNNSNTFFANNGYAYENHYYVHVSNIAPTGFKTPDYYNSMIKFLNLQKLPQSDLSRFSILQ